MQLIRTQKQVRTSFVKTLSSKLLVPKETTPEKKRGIPFGMQNRFSNHWRLPFLSQKKRRKPFDDKKGTFRRVLCTPYIQWRVISLTSHTMLNSDRRNWGAENKISFSQRSFDALCACPAATTGSGRIFYTPEKKDKKNLRNAKIKGGLAGGA